MKRRLMGVLLLSFVFFFPVTVRAEPVSETEGVIMALQERLMVLNDTIATKLLQQEEQEARITVLKKEQEKQAEALRAAKEKLNRLEKEVQERLKALQLKEADREVVFFSMDNWSTALRALYSAETVRKADETRVKEYESQVKKVDQATQVVQEQRLALEKAQKELAETIKEQEKSKAALTQEITENQEQLAALKAEEERQAVLREAEQAALLEELARTSITKEATDSEQAEEAQTQAQEIILSAREFLGVPYVWGGTTPQGFDCSGLMQYVFAKHGVSLPRVSQAQQAAAKEVPLSELQPGDLVFWGRPAHHVGLYIGDGYFIHAPQPGEVVKVTHVSWFPYQSVGRVLA